LEKEFGEELGRLRSLIAGGWLSPVPDGPVDAQGQPRAFEPNPDHATANAAHYLARWIPARVDYCLNKRGMEYVDNNYLAGGMTRDHVLTGMGIGQTRTAAENWLRAAASAGLVVAEEIVHPQSPSKVITTWRLPQEAPARPTTEDAPDEVRATEAAKTEHVPPQPTTDSLRHLLTHGLNDEGLTRLIFEHFRALHRAVEGAPKEIRIQALLDYVERRGLHDQLRAAAHEVNPALTDARQDLPLAA